MSSSSSSLPSSLPSSSSSSLPSSPPSSSPSPSLPSNPFPMREVRFGRVCFNPITGGCACLFLLLLVVWCLVDPEGALEDLIGGKQWCSLTFGWFYVVTQVGWGIFLVVVFLRFGHIKLGGPNDEPEFPPHTYFAMLFCAGIATGLFYYGVAEPMIHQQNNRYASVLYHSQDEIDLYALNLTIFHWGLGGWVVYALVALSCCLSAYCFSLPLTMRSCFFFLFGDFVWGWMGDLVDIMSVVTVVSGVCTSLGLGAIQLVAGLERIHILPSPSPSSSETSRTTAYIITVWIVTFTATISVLTGLGKGIKILSQSAFCLGLLLWLAVFLLDDTVYLLNLFVEEVGYYFQNIIQIHFRTDAFASLAPGQGRSSDHLSADRLWMDSWTIFYWSWWTSWAAFVGLFIAKISKGRTISEVISYSLGGALLYVMLWFVVFGGVGIRSQRRAFEVEELGVLLYNDRYHYAVPWEEGGGEGGELEGCYTAPDMVVYTNKETGEVVYEGDGLYVEEYKNNPLYTLYYENKDPGINPVCVLPSDPSIAWFNVLEQYYDLGWFLSSWSLICIYIYFVTSSDSGSLIVDYVASNGKQGDHPVQRVFWAFVEGGLATALLFAGGENSLVALQAASIISALPYTLIMCVLCVSTWKMCEAANEGKTDLNYVKEVIVKDFEMPVYGGIFNIFEWVFSGFGKFSHPDRVQTMPFPSNSIILSFFLSLLVPPLPYYQILSPLSPPSSWKWTPLIWGIICGVFFYGFLSVALLSLIFSSIPLFVFSVIFYSLFVALVVSLRREGRREKKKREEREERGKIGGKQKESDEGVGEVVGDVLVCFAIYPQVLVQVYQFCLNELPHSEGRGSGEE